MGYSHVGPSVFLFSLFYFVWGGGGSQAGSLQQQQQHLSLSMRCVGCFGVPLLNQFDYFF
jgi:hypothetical protein